MSHTSEVVDANGNVWTLIHDGSPVDGSTITFVVSQSLAESLKFLAAEPWYDANTQYVDIQIPFEIIRKFIKNIELSNQISELESQYER